MSTGLFDDCKLTNHETELEIYLALIEIPSQGTSFHLATCHDLFCYPHSVLQMTLGLLIKYVSILIFKH